MRSLACTGPQKLEWQEAATPSLQSDGDALVRPIAVATCDLDGAMIAGETPFPAPIALGHEGVAEVVEVGDGVRSISPGTLVSVPFQVSCGECEACRRGRTGNCRSVRGTAMYGFGAVGGDWGGFLSDVVRVPWADHMLVPLPQGLDPAAVASASDNIPDAWRTVGPPLEREPGAAVLIVGGAGSGSIGLYAAGIARVLGAERVAYVDADAGRRATAAGFGAEALEPGPERLGPFAITVDASGDPAGLQLALSSTAPDGVCTSTAIYFGEPVPMPLFEMYLKIVTFETGRVHARPAMPDVLELAAGDGFRPQDVTTKVVPWDDMPAALLEPDWVKLVAQRTA
jgi:threonine dehydrogenase-like Zn-dependent dehydrogenase